MIFLKIDKTPSFQYTSHFTKSSKDESLFGISIKPNYPEMISTIILLCLFTGLPSFTLGRGGGNDIKQLALTATTTADVSLRKGNGTKYKALCIIPAGSQVNIINIKNNWCKVTFKNRTGFVLMQYLDFNQKETKKSGVVEGKNNSIFDWLIFSFPLLWAFAMFNPVRPGYSFLTIRGHLLIASAFIIIPMIKILVWYYGENVFLSWSITKIVISIFNISDLIALGALLIKFLKTKAPYVIVTFIMVLSLVVSGDHYGAVGGICLSVLSTAMAFDEILLDTFESGSGNPMERYFT